MKFRGFLAIKKAGRPGLKRRDTLLSLPIPAFSVDYPERSRRK